MAHASYVQPQVGLAGAYKPTIGGMGLCREFEEFNGFVEDHPDPISLGCIMALKVLPPRAWTLIARPRNHEISGVKDHTIQL
jgi:hypothetical protein